MSEAEWFKGYSPVTFINDAGKLETQDTGNVVGRFVDGKIINVKRSEELGRSEYDIIPVIETKALIISGMVTNDVSTRKIVFTTRESINASLEQIKRFPKAWEAYQKYRKAPVTENEEKHVGGTKAKKPGRKPNKVLTADDVFNTNVRPIGLKRTGKRETPIA